MGLRQKKDKNGIVTGRTWQENDNKLPKVFNVYKFSQFLDLMADGNLERKMRRAQRKDTDLAANIDSLYDYGRADGYIDFNNINQYALFDSLVPDILNRTKCDRILGA
jgi:hypothetical protein